MKPIVRKILMITLALTFLTGASVIVDRIRQSAADRAALTEAETLIEEPLPLSAPAEEDVTVPEEVFVWKEAPVCDDSYMDTLRETNLEALREVNEDVIGWIVIPDTQLAYPLMYGGDNDYYLHHTWKKEASDAGSIFLEQYCSTDLSDFNSIVYGHRMINGSMFATLKYYNQQTFWEQHPYVYVYDDAGAHRYEIFSAYEADVTGATYRLKIDDADDRQAFLDACTGWSVIDTGVVPGIYDRILTLSTCTGTGYNTRWVVQARLAVDPAALPPT